MTLIDKIVYYMFLLLIGPVFKLVYLSSDVEKKVTLFCIISILVLLIHIYHFIFVSLGTVLLVSLAHLLFHDSYQYVLQHSV